MHGFQRIAAISFLGLLLAPGAQAYVRTMAQSGRPLYWQSPVVQLQANPGNSSGLSQAQIGTLFGSALANWQSVDSPARFGFTQSSGAPASSANDGINALYFSSRSGASLDWGVVALTEVLYYVSTGLIAESDTAFNDKQFLFTSNAGDTGKTINGRTAIYLADVATHEAGHTMGLDHSTVNLSSMIYTAFSGQYSSSPDDKNALRTVYPGGGQRSALSGTVRGTAGGIFGAHVAAVNLSTGKVEAGTLANPDGTFRIGDLPPGKYAVLMEPFGVDSSTVSAYFSTVDHRFCPGSSRFRRRFYSACGSQGVATVVDAANGSNSQLGTLAPSCSAMGNPGGAPDSLAGAREVPAAGGALFGTLPTGGAHYYLVRGFSGHLTARAMSYSLYSPVDVQVAILDASGHPVDGATSVDNVESPMPGGKVNYDSLATANLPAGDYVIRVSAAASRLPASAFSAGYELLDANGHYLLAIGANGGFGDPGISDMSGCVSVPNSVQNATYDPNAGNSGNDTQTGCGSLNSSGGNPFSGGMMLVLLTALGLQLLARARRARLALVRKRR